MILRHEIAEYAKEWGIPPDTVDKDYVLGHFLSSFYDHYGDELIFKGGTCLRKCYFPNYRFSEDLDFSSIDNKFELKKSDLISICTQLEEKTGIQFHQENIIPLVSKDIFKGYQVKIKYWGANHSRHDEPPSKIKWTTKIKLEISTDELCVQPFENKKVIHQYSDRLPGANKITCYSIDEIISEKLRSLVQRSYSAPRDIYDIYYLTQYFTSDDWNRIKPIFIRKMEHKKIEFTGPDQLISQDRIPIFLRAWDRSIAHQIDHRGNSKEMIIGHVYDVIHTYVKSQLITNS